MAKNGGAPGGAEGRTENAAAGSNVRRQAGSSAWTTAARAGVIGMGSVSAAFAVSWVAVSWVAVGPGRGSGTGALDSPGGWLRDGGSWIALPCAVIAWGLTAWSLHLTRGLATGARQFSLVLWGAATPCVYGFAAMLWFGLASGEWGEGGLFWMATTLLGSAIWLVTLTPLFVMLIARPLLARDPATVPASPSAAAVTGRDERDEDLETGLRGARGSLREVLGRDS